MRESVEIDMIILIICSTAQASMGLDPTTIIMSRSCESRFVVLDRRLGTGLHRLNSRWNHRLSRVDFPAP